MGLDIAHSHTLSNLQRAILTTSALMGPESINNLIVGVQLNEISKLNYSDLLKATVKNRTVCVPGGLFSKESHHDAFETILKASPYSKDQIRKEIEFLEHMELLERVKYSPATSLIDPAIGAIADFYMSPIYYFIRPIFLTKEGLRLAQAIADGRVPLVRPPRAEKTTIFFAGAFGHHDIDMLCDQEIEPACKQLGYPMYRVDAREPFQTIISLVLSGIQNSACVVADLTYARPSVYFEIGYAHGLGIALVLTCEDGYLQSADDILKVHFDLAQFRISLWKIDKSGKFSWPKRMNPAERLKVVLE
jgi:hypothetical protein